jgi:hypothetical protein
VKGEVQDGDGVRSKTDTALKNEPLLKLLCHNVVVVHQAVAELGIEPVFCERPVNARLASSRSLCVLLDGRTPPCDDVVTSGSGPGASGSTPGSGLACRSTLSAAGTSND